VTKKLIFTVECKNLGTPYGACFFVSCKFVNLKHMNGVL